MSLCYDFQKWTMITFASVAISLTVGLLLINFAHGQEVFGLSTCDKDHYQGNKVFCDMEAELNKTRGYYTAQDEEMFYAQGQFDTVINYCVEHAGDKLNPLQELLGQKLNPINDLVDKGLVSKYFKDMDCQMAKIISDSIGQTLFLREHPEVIK